MAEAHNTKRKFQKPHKFLQCDKEIDELLFVNDASKNFYGPLYQAAGATPEEIFESMSEQGFADIVNTNRTEWPQAVQGQFQFWKQLFVQETGIQVFFIPASYYQWNQPSYLVDDYYLVYRLNARMVNRPEEFGAPTQKGGGAITYYTAANATQLPNATPFQPWEWEANKAVVNEETLEKQVKKMEFQDKTFISTLTSFTGGDTSKIPKKFDFVFNIGYTRKDFECSSKGDLQLGAENNNECVFFNKSKDGILCFNWATKDYKDDPDKGCVRPKLGSYNAISASLKSMLDAMAEKQIITYAFDEEGGAKFDDKE